MFPRNYFGLFPPFPRENKVFVAMSFDDRFLPRWENVILPAIRNVAVNDAALEPDRVDARRIGDSILTEILGGVTNDRLILADVSTLGHVNGRPIRNGNVMYEIGLAHSVRLPEEVLIFRSDSDHLLFDVANVRVNSYDPDGDPAGARSQVSDAIIESLKELDLKRNLAVKSAAQSLDFTGWWVLSMAATNNGVHHFQTKTVGQVLGNAANNAAIIRLLEFGALETDYAKLTPELVKQPDGSAEHLLKYKATPFGKAILNYAASEMVGTSPEIQSLLAQMFAKTDA
jgi:hypothetical protein